MDLEDVAASGDELEIGTSEKPEELGVDAMESLEVKKESDASGNLVDSIGFTKALLRSSSCDVLRGVDVIGGVHVLDLGRDEYRLFRLLTCLTTTAAASKFSLSGAARTTSLSLSS